MYQELISIQMIGFIYSSVEDKALDTKQATDTSTFINIQLSWTFAS